MPSIFLFFSLFLYTIYKMKESPSNIWKSVNTELFPAKDSNRTKETLPRDKFCWKWHSGIAYINLEAVKLLG